MHVVYWKKLFSDLILDTMIFVRPAAAPPPNAYRTPPWILKQAGLETSGQRLREGFKKKKV